MSFISLEFIALENFQSLKKRAEIPIRPLTFLYGPNSSGKSAIHDALTFLDSFFRSPDEEIRDYIERWAYKPKGKELPYTSEDLHMSVEARFSSDESFTFFHSWLYGSAGATPTEFYFESVGINSIELRLEVIDLINEFYNVLFTASFNGQKMIELVPRAGGFSEYDYLLIIHVKTFDNVITDLADRHEIEINNENIVEVPCRLVHEKEIKLKEDTHLEGQPYNFHRDLISIGNHILHCFRDIKFAPEIISADRTTISSKELSCVLSSETRYDERDALSGYSSFSVGLPKDHIESPTKSLQGVLNLSSSFMQEIAISRFLLELKRREIEIKNQNERRTEFLPKEALVDYVNRCLADHLFLDQGYQIVHEIFEILPPTPPNKKQSFFAALLICSLMDKSGRRMTFEDVGTGISCLIPMLVTLYSNASFIQQPELHLHPALQSAFGDILVETTKEKRGYKHIIETHSEYILLRCLRRIRETTKGKHSAQSPIALTPDDISVLYFCPQADGSTEVKKLRVSSQGDFIDRWPRGFFEERGKELFDE